MARNEHVHDPHRADETTPTEEERRKPSVPHVPKKRRAVRIRTSKHTDARMVEADASPRDRAKKTSHQQGNYQTAALLFQNLANENKQPEDECEKLLCNASAAWLRAGENRKALDSAEEAVECNPRWAKAYFRRGEAWFALKDFRQSLHDFGKAKELSQGQDKVLDKCLSAAEEALELQDSMKDMEKELKDLELKEVESSENDRPKKDVEELTRDAEDRERDPKVRNMLKHAEQLATSFATKEAAELFERAFRLDKTCTEAITRASAMHLSIGEDQKALNCAKAALEVDARSISAYIILGTIFERMGKLEEAEPLLAKAVGLAFDYPETHVRFANNLLQQGKVRLAADVLRFALSGGPEGKMEKPSKDLKVHFTMGYLQALRGYTAEPITIFSELVQGAPSPACAYLLARSLLAAGDKAQAMAAVDYLQTIKESVPAYFHMDMSWMVNTFDLPCWDGVTNRWSLYKLMEQQFPDANHVPYTYLLPGELDEWRKSTSVENQQHWVVRNQYQIGPTDLAYIKQTAEPCTFQECIVQRCVTDCRQIAGRKFTLGLFVVIVSADPLEAYILEEGLVYFAETGENQGLEQSFITRSRKKEPLAQSKWETQQESSKQLQSFFERQKHLQAGKGQPTDQSNLDAVAPSDFLQRDFSPQEDTDHAENIGTLAEHCVQFSNWDQIWSAIVRIAEAFTKISGLVAKEAKGEIRAAYHSHLRIPKIFELEIVLDSNSEPWLLSAERYPLLEGSGKALITRRRIVNEAFHLALADLLGDQERSSINSVPLHL